VAELTDFVEATRGGGSLQANSTLGKNVVRIAEASELSLRAGGAEVALNGRRFAGTAPGRGQHVMDDEPVG
jgi:hypothetical protein